MRRVRIALPRTVIVVGLVSLLHDAGSEMVLPLVPAFLATLGAGPAALGLIEGLADASSAALKLWSGLLADRGARLKRLTVLGYALANLARPLNFLATSWGHVLLVRFADRVGKGLRTTPRDRLLADSVAAADRGRAFGFHRAMDHTGAVLGPLLAIVAIRLNVEVRSIFLLSAIPGALAVIIALQGLPDPPPTPGASDTATLRLPHAKGIGRFLLAVALSTAASPADAFLLWRARELGVSLEGGLALWMVLHVCRAVVSEQLGRLSDRLGRPRTLVLVWSVMGAALFGLGWVANDGWLGMGLLALAGTMSGTMDGLEKALAVDLVEPAERGRALGSYHFASGFAALPSAAGFGLLYAAVGAPGAFSAVAAISVLSSALVLSLPRRS